MSNDLEDMVKHLDQMIESVREMRSKNKVIDFTIPEMTDDEDEALHAMNKARRVLLGAVEDVVDDAVKRRLDKVIGALTDQIESLHRTAARRGD